MNISMNKETLKAMAKEFAKDIKTQDDLNLFTKELVKLTVEAALNTDQQSSSLNFLPVQISGLSKPQPRTGACLVLTSPSGWQLQFQDLPSAQWLQELMHHHSCKDAFKRCWATKKSTTLFIWLWILWICDWGWTACLLRFNHSCKPTPVRGIYLCLKIKEAIVLKF